MQQPLQAKAFSTNAATATFPGIESTPVISLSLSKEEPILTQSNIIIPLKAEYFAHYMHSHHKKKIVSTVLDILIFCAALRYAGLSCAHFMKNAISAYTHCTISSDCVL